MKIFDCFMYFDEEVVLEVRLNTLDKFVDYFVIVESSFTHKGDPRDLRFSQKKFEKFKDKIIYLIHGKNFKDIEIINDGEGFPANIFLMLTVEKMHKEIIFKKV